MNHIHLKQAISSNRINGFIHSCSNSTMDTNTLGLIVFAKTSNDDKHAFSIEDEPFLKVMDEQVFQDESNS